jgi:hypothetical protein
MMKRLFLFIVVLLVISIAGITAVYSFSQLASSGGSATTSTEYVTTSSYTLVQVQGGHTITTTETEVIQPAVSVTLVTSTSTVANTTTTFTETLTNTTTCTIWSNGTSTC